MPKYFDPEKPNPDEFEKRVKPLISDRKVRPVVTPSGHRARGRFPSLKGRESNYESLVEEDALRIFEISTSVRKVHTHPFVLKLRSGGTGGKSFHYTPDALLMFVDTVVLAEVKGDWLLKLPKPRASLVRTLKALRLDAVPVVLMTETDIRPPGLQTELQLLLKDRPVCTRLRKDVDLTKWDPTGVSEPYGDTSRRWKEAQRECDALLDRVMRRDPDDLIEALSR